MGTGGSHGRGWGARRRPVAPQHCQGGKGIPSVCTSTARVQILDGMYTGRVHGIRDDFLRGIRHTRFLADIAHVLWCAVFHDDETTNCSHVQTQVRTNQFWVSEVKAQKCRQGKWNVWRWRLRVRGCQRRKSRWDGWVEVEVCDEDEDETGMRNDFNARAEHVERLL